MEHDGNLYLNAFSEFRKVDFTNPYAPLEGISEGFICLYIDGKSADYVHDSLPCEDDAIDFLKNNNQIIHDNILAALKKDKRFLEKYVFRKELAIISASVLESDKEGVSYLGIDFLNRENKFLNILLHKENVIHISDFSIENYSTSDFEKVLIQLLSKKKWYQFWK